MDFMNITYLEQRYYNLSLNQVSETHSDLFTINHQCPLTKMPFVFSFRHSVNKMAFLSSICKDIIQASMIVPLFTLFISLRYSFTVCFNARD